jgi:hypothetical protein
MPRCAALRFAPRGPHWSPGAWQPPLLPAQPAQPRAPSAVPFRPAGAPHQQSVWVALVEQRALRGLLHDELGVCGRAQRGLGERRQADDVHAAREGHGLLRVAVDPARDKAGADRWQEAEAWQRGTRGRRGERADDIAAREQRAQQAAAAGLDRCERLRHGRHCTRD